MKTFASFALMATGSIVACSSDSSDTPVVPVEQVPSPTPTTTSTPTPPPASTETPKPDLTAALKAKVKHVIVVFAENRGFDNIYGRFPGADGLANAASATQKDRDGTTLAKLPQTWGGVTAAGVGPVVTQAMSDNLANAPYPLETTYEGVDATVITRDLYHRFYENQMQIHGGANDRFAAYADSGGLVMANYDGSKMAMWKVAQKYVLADAFFMGAFGGSFLNHQYLVCACAPEFPNADTDPAKPTIAALDKDANDKFLPFLSIDPSTPASSLDGAPTFVLSGNIAPKDYFGDGTFRAVNTMQPPYQPSFNPPAAGGSPLLADRTKPTTLPPQTQATIADRLDEKGISWKWYAGGYTATSAIATSSRAFPASTPGSAPNYQMHHHPFNYYAKFDPTTSPLARAEHFADYTDLLGDLENDRLPAVMFYKPQGDLNQHAGYASLDAGDKHIAELISKIENSKSFGETLVIVTYDENGGFWDHVAPPPGDKLGPGTRVPAIIVAPFVKKGTVDHTTYDTASIQRLLNRRFDLQPLPGLSSRPNMGDLVNALAL